MQHGRLDASRPVLGQHNLGYFGHRRLEKKTSRSTITRELKRGCGRSRDAQKSLDQYSTMCMLTSTLSSRSVPSDPVAEAAMRKGISKIGFVNSRFLFTFFFLSRFDLAIDPWGIERVMVILARPHHDAADRAPF